MPTNNNNEINNKEQDNRQVDTNKQELKSTENKNINAPAPPSAGIAQAQTVKLPEAKLEKLEKHAEKTATTTKDPEDEPPKVIYSDGRTKLVSSSAELQQIIDEDGRCSNCNKLLRLSKNIYADDPNLKMPKTKDTKQPMFRSPGQPEGKFGVFFCFDCMSRPGYKPEVRQVIIKSKEGNLIQLPIDAIQSITKAQEEEEQRAKLIKEKEKQREKQAKKR